METEPSPQLFVKDWAKKHWQVLSAFAAGILLGALAMQQGYEGLSIGGTEYAFVKKASIPKSLSIQGNWFYETRTSGVPLQYGDLKCTSILGTADISQAAASNEFSVNNATRRGCVNSESQVIKTNVGWHSINAAVLPDSRKIVVSLITADPNPRIAYIEGAIPESITEDSPSQFEGNMYYLNTQNQTYGSTTITFCKAETKCAQEMARKLEEK